MFPNRDGDLLWMNRCQIGLSVKSLTSRSRSPNREDNFLQGDLHASLCEQVSDQPRCVVNAQVMDVS